MTSLSRTLGGLSPPLAIHQTVAVHVLVGREAVAMILPTLALCFIAKL